MTRTRVIDARVARKDRVKQPMTKKVCIVCKKAVKKWPMCFRGDDTCSVLCQKAAVNG